MKYWSDIAALKDIRRINKFEVLEYSLRMWIKFESRNLCLRIEKKYVLSETKYDSEEISYINSNWIYRCVAVSAITNVNKLLICYLRNEVKSRIY